MFVRSILILGTLVASFQCNSTLQCYSCSSATDSNCGSTFGYTEGSDAAKAIVVECTGLLTACRKIKHEDTYYRSDKHILVERSCWTNNNENATLEEDFYECEDDHFYGEVCYCNEDKCNNQGRIAPTLATFLLGLLPLGFFPL